MKKKKKQTQGEQELIITWELNKLRRIIIIFIIFYLKHCWLLKNTVSSRLKKIFSLGLTCSNLIKYTSVNKLKCFSFLPTWIRQNSETLSEYSFMAIIVFAQIHKICSPCKQDTTETLVVLSGLWVEGHIWETHA